MPRILLILVLVPVVQVGPVAMAVHDRRVAMAVGVPDRSRRAGVRMVVMPVVMAGGARGRPVGVGVDVRVLIDREQRDARGEQQCGSEVAAVERFAEE